MAEDNINANNSNLTHKRGVILLSIIALMIWIMIIVFLYFAYLHNICLFAYCTGNY